MPTSTEEIDIAKLLINGRQGRAFRDFDRDMKEWLKAQYMHIAPGFCFSWRAGSPCTFRRFFLLRDEIW